MGNKPCVFKPEELEEYSELTYFTKVDVLKCFERFKNLAPEIVAEDRNARLPMEIMLTHPELKVNPFGDRICIVFSSSKDGDCTFEDFLDMMSVFSNEAAVSLKTEYAFRIFDFDGDDMLGSQDMEEIIRRLLGDDELPADDVTKLVQNLTAEGDLDDDGMLSFAEFEHAVAKSKDFAKSFYMRL